MPRPNQKLVSMHGEYWCREKKNFLAIKNTYQNPVGLYALYSGLTPVYFGKGRIASRLRNHDKSGSRGRYWDHFSWYKIEEKEILQDLEILLLRILPVYLHMLNRQRGKFLGSTKAKQAGGRTCELIRPKYGVGAKHRRKSK